MNQSEPVRLMIVAGEASGDRHAGALVDSLREASPETIFDFFGMTGERMRRAGVRSVVAGEDLAIVGLLEVGRALPKFLRVFRELKRAAESEKPAAAILVDYPEFNLPLASALKRRGIPVIYYISPQLWAWRSYRVRRVKRDVDLLLTILPFEQKWYAANDFDRAEFVGHPLVGEVRTTRTRAEFCRLHDLDSSRPVVALLPGSRRQELARHLPLMLAAAGELRATIPTAQFVVALARNRDLHEVHAALDQAFDIDENLKAAVRVVHGETYDALGAADAAAVASGTATLEAALTNTPMVVVYKESAFNWHTLGRLIDIEHFALPNLIANERVATELIQHDFTPARLASELTLLLDPERNRDTRARLQAVVTKLGAQGSSARAAEAVLKFMNRNKR